MQKSKIKKLLSVISYQLLVAKRGERGVTLAFSLIVLSNMLLIAIAIGIFSINQLKITASARDSAYAIFAATTGLERALYQVRKADDCNDIPETTMPPSPDLKYQVNVVATCPSPVTAAISSIGTFRQTSRKIDASW